MRLQQMSAVSYSSSGTKSSRHMNGFDEFLLRSAGVNGCVPMQLDAVDTLRGESGGNRHEFLVFFGNCSASKCGLVVGLESVSGLWRELAESGKLLEIVDGMHSLAPLNLWFVLTQPGVAITSRRTCLGRQRTARRSYRKTSKILFVVVARASLERSPLSCMCATVDVEHLARDE